MSAHEHATKQLTAAQVTIPEDHPIRKIPMIGALLGVLGIGGAAALGMGEDGSFYHSYLVAFMYFLSIALGGLFFVIIQFVTRSGWSVVIRRLAENIMASLPVFALLFVPILFGMHDLYHWTHADAVATDALLQVKQPFLNESAFLMRGVFYFAIWSAMAWFFYKKSTSQDSSGDHGITAMLQRVAAPAVIVYGLSQTFAAVDWMMTLDPHWYSTMWGVYYFAGSFVAILAVLALVSIHLSREGQPLEGIVTVEHRHDLGKLLWGFMVFWTYIAFSQYFLIWYANIPEETLFYAHRAEGTWDAMSIFLSVGHFGIPFFCFMSRHVKRSARGLAFFATWMLFMHYVDLYWIVMPILHHHGVHFSAVDVLAFIGVGGVFLGTVAWIVPRNLLVPIRDPRLPESLSFENF